MEKVKNLITVIIKKVFSREIIFYGIFGVLTTIVNFACFFALTSFLYLEENLSNVISIFIAVTFAYVTNRKLVFNSTAKTSKDIFAEIYRFFIGRGATMLVEFFGFMLLFNVIHIHKDISKALVTILVIILNYFFSKFFAFKQNK